MTSLRSTAVVSISLACWVLVAAVVVRAQARDSDGWLIPEGALDEANPIPVSASVLAKGQDIYKKKCQRCHGETGKGNGPDAERKHPPGNLTDSSRASRNPDGVMFYKIWNGRPDPKMPAFKTDLPRNDVWTVVHFVKTLRGAP